MPWGWGGAQSGGRPEGHVQGVLGTSVKELLVATQEGLAWRLSLLLPAPVKTSSWGPSPIKQVPQDIIVS